MSDKPHLHLVESAKTSDPGADQVVNLEEFRKANSTHPKDWSAVDALKLAIKQIETGEWPATRIYVAAAWIDSNGGWSRGYTCAGCENDLEVVGLIQRHLADRVAGGD